MGLVYLAGPASTPETANRLAYGAQDLGEHMRDEAVAWARLVTSCAERIEAACRADLVVLTADWATDLLSRRDAQVAVWADKPIKLYLPTKRAPKLNGGSAPVLREMTAEHITTVLDRGLDLTFIEGVESIEGDTQP